MWLCVEDSWCANQSFSSSSHQHWACVPTAVLRTLWFLNLLCSTLAATDKSCLFHHHGFLFSVHVLHLSLSFTSFMSRWCSWEHCSLEHVVLGSCLLNLLQIFSVSLCSKRPEIVGISNRRICTHTHTLTVTAAHMHALNTLKQTHTKSEMQGILLHNSPHHFAAWHGKIDYTV